MDIGPIYLFATFVHSMISSIFLKESYDYEKHFCYHRLRTARHSML